MSEDTCAVCDGGVHEAEPIAATHEGEEFRFCSDEHLLEFRRSAERFA